MRVIEKKTWPDMFEAVASGKKKADMRVNDFDVEEGDALVLKEWNPETGEYTGRELEKKVTHVAEFDLNSFGQAEEIKEKGIQIISLE